MVPDREVPGKKPTTQSYISMADPYDKPKPKPDPKSLKKKPQFQTASKFKPAKGTYLHKDDGCFGRFHYEKQGYGETIKFKERSLAGDKKAAGCHRGVPFGSKMGNRRDEFHQHIAQLQYKEQLDKEQRFEKEMAKRNKSKNPDNETTMKPAVQRKPKLVFDQHNASASAGGFDTTWKSKTNEWIEKKGYGIKPVKTGTMKTSSQQYGNFDLNIISRPKHARISVTREFNDISHLN